MSLEVFRDRLDSFREQADREARELKDSYLALERLATFYDGLDDHERALANRVLCEWVLSEDSGRRFDAMALVRKFHVVEAVPALVELSERLRQAEGPGAPFERQKAEGLAAELEADAREV